MDLEAHIGETAELVGALQALSEGIAVFDADDALVFCNRRFREMNQNLAHVLQNGLLWPVLIKEMAQHGVRGVLEQLEHRLESDIAGDVGSSQTLETPWPGDRWMRVGLSLTRSGGLVLTLSDVTESAEAAELRAEADSLLRQVLDACAVNLMMTRISDGKILYRNQAAVELVGQRHAAVEIFNDPDVRPDILADLLATGFIDNFEVELLRGDGTSFPARVSARLVDYRGEEVIVSSVTDMTQLYAQRDALARQREATFQNEKLTALGELLAGVAHELNNPLSVVVGQSLMLQEDTEDAEMSRRVQKISQSAERCAKIVKTFLAMARQEPARLEPASINEIVLIAIDVAGYGIRSKGGTVIQDLFADLPNALADPDQIAQVLINLLMNAEQATAGRQTAARIAVKTWSDARSQQVKVSVTDNGEGVAPNLRARIFEPFFTTKGDGAGIGLALCHRILSAHGGSLKVEDAEGGGAKFTLSLPLAHYEAATGPTNLQPVKPCLHALVVDDDRDVADMLADMLATLGVRATIALSGEEALQRLDGGAKPDIILSDFVMPGIGGDGLLRQLRCDWPKLATRLAFVTGDSLSSDAASLGPPVIEKPVAPHELRKLVREMID